jgi:hypothetical protein
MVSDSQWFEEQLLTSVQLKYALSVQVWPSGHATDSEEAIAFTELHNINCKVEEFPLEKANEAYGKFYCPQCIPITALILFIYRGNVEGNSQVPGRYHHGVIQGTEIGLGER